MLDSSTIDYLKRGRSTAAVCYAQALYHKQEIESCFSNFLDDWDIVLAPATACTAFPCGWPPATIDGQPVDPDWKGFAPFNVYGNLTRAPVAVVPAGQSQDKLPVGVLVFSKYGRDDLVLQVCKVVEDAQPWLREPQAS